MLRQIALDTETTGIGHELGHRIIEIGCVEMIDRKLTGKSFHTYLNPQREVDAGAFKVHGLSSEFLQDKPLFQDVVKEFLEFIDGAEFIIHNAPFDVGFLNAELKTIGWSQSLEAYGRVVDTLVLAREKHPGQRNSLDALCKRYTVDNSNRQWHGALLDADLLAQVYLAMTGGQITFALDEDVSDTLLTNAGSEKNSTLASSRSPVQFANAEELSRHEAFLQFLQQQNQ